MRAKSKSGWKVFCVWVLLCATCFGEEEIEIRLKDTPESTAVRQSRQAVLASAKSSGVIGRKVRYVKIKGLWARGVQLPLATGDVLTPESLSAALAALQLAIHKNATSHLGLQSKGEVAVLYIAVDFDSSEDTAAVSNGLKRKRKSVGVTFRPYYVHLSLVQIGDNVLPIPRTPFPTFYDKVPPPLRALHPVIGLSHDRAFGTAMTGAFDTDLLTLVAASDANRLLQGEHHLQIRGQGMVAVEESFYRADIGLRYSVRRDAGLVQELAFSSDFVGTDEPFGDGEHERKAGSAAIAMKLKMAPNTRFWLDTGYRRTDDRVTNSDGNSDTSANEQTGRLLLDVIPPSINGFLRAAVWEEAGWQSGSGGAYQRLAGRIGYEKEIPLAPNQALGIEILAGGGKTFGDRPAYTQFFGGNADNRFLYNSASSVALTGMPSGPVIRSFGENEAALRDKQGRLVGGDTFWHVNMNVAIPIPFLSRSLIPNEVTDIPDENDNPMTLRQLLGRQVDVSGPSLLAATLKKQGLSDQEASTRAREILQEITPAAHYIINDANFYAIKPLVMFDAAGMSGQNASSETWLAAGAGIQLTIVTAKLELGYMQTISGPTFGSHHNIFARLVFQNLF